MDQETIKALNQLNFEFYTQHAGSFSQTRQRAWEGWKRLLDDFTDTTRLWDVGCGNGRFLHFLAANGRNLDCYVGWDLSPKLLDEAQKTCASLARQTKFVCADLLGHRDDVAEVPVDIHRICLFGVLHHIPGFQVRVQLLRQLMESLAPGGMLIVTLWRFRTRGRPTRTVSPSELGLSGLEEGDYLLGFGHDQRAVRYAHHFDEQEIDRLIETLNAIVIDRYDADGRDQDANTYIKIAI